MAVPKYHETYRAFLEALADGTQHKLGHIVEYVADALNVSEEDQKVMVTNQVKTKLYNNVSWAATYLKKAGLVHSPARAIFEITKIGVAALKDSSIKIDNTYLAQFDSFKEFKNLGQTDTRADIQEIDESETPLEQLENAVLQMNKRLEDELLDEIMKQSPNFFERLVVSLLTKMGYGGSVENAGLVVGKSGDEGIDGIIREDKLGFDLIYIQAKRWEPTKTVGRPEIQAFVGALAGQGATKGLFVTTAKFSKEAEKYVEKQHTTKVVLLDGQKLCSLMIEHDLGVSVETVYQIKKIDIDFFEEDMS